MTQILDIVCGPHTFINGVSGCQNFANYAASYF